MGAARQKEKGVMKQNVKKIRLKIQNHQLEDSFTFFLTPWHLFSIKEKTWADAVLTVFSDGLI